MESDGPVLEHLSRGECIRLCVDGASRFGWSVTVVGPSRAITGIDEIRRLEQVTPVPWAPGKHDHFIRVSAVFVTGRRISAGKATEDRQGGGPAPAKR